MADEMELKPCPFCGSPAFWQEACATYWAACTTCLANGQSVDTLDEAITAWNTRTQSQRITELEDALRPFADEAKRKGWTAEHDRFSWLGSGLSYGDFRRASSVLSKGED